jgi:hypothetical protein
LEIQSVEGEGSEFTCHFPPLRLAAVAKSGASGYAPAQDS